MPKPAAKHKKVVHFKATNQIVCDCNELIMYSFPQVMFMCFFFTLAVSIIIKLQSAWSAFLLNTPLCWTVGVSDTILLILP